MKMNQYGSPQEGQITYGAEATEVQPGSQWVLNWQTLQHGYILRDGGSVNGEVYESVFQPLPQDLRPTKGNETWRPSYRGSLVCISGEDVGVEVEYGGDAGGMTKFFGMIMGALSSQLDVSPDSLYPVVTWDVTSYFSKKQKKDIYEATGKIVSWLSQDELEALAGDGAEEVVQSDVLPAEEDPATQQDFENTMNPDPAPPEPATRSRRPAAGAAGVSSGAVTTEPEKPPARTATRRRQRQAAVPKP